jgi:adenylyl-sulfate kinase
MTFTIWFTGLPCSGKTTIAKQMLQNIKNDSPKIVHLDGDVVRTGLCKDLGFSKEDRQENLRRVSHLCQIFNENGIIVLATFVSPTKKDRDLIKNIISDCRMVFVNAPQEICEKRDVKGMYALARKGVIKEFTGVSAPFDIPKDPALIVDTKKESINGSANKLIAFFKF